MPNFFDNTRRSPLFEGKFGKADILFCGFDLSAQDLVSAQLRESIACYIESEKFAPAQTIPCGEFLELLE